jgi:hypothetical protein
VLDGFGRQTVASDRIERVVFAPAAGTTLAAARNSAFAQAAAPLVLWFDGRFWPFPGLIEYCLDVFRTRSEAADTLLLSVHGDAALRRNLLHRWLRLTRREPGQPEAGGVYAWPYFRLHALVCRRELMETASFDERFHAGEDLQLAARLTRSVPLRVLYEATPQATCLAPPALPDSLEGEYLDGYFRRVRTAEDPRARTISDVDDRFAFAERFVRTRAEIATLSASLTALEATVADVEPELAIGEDADRLQLVYQLYDALFSHAAAHGWLDAERGTPARPERLWKPRAQPARRPSRRPSSNGRRKQR